jgi:branched-chain amino acid transport system ATP-binding protein
MAADSNPNIGREIKKTVLTIRNLHKDFGRMTVVNDLSFEVNPNEIFAIIGPNGAGKTTTFNLLSGLIPADAGDIRFDGESVSGLAAYVIAEKGMVRTFQTVSLFDSMTVLDNVKVGCHPRFSSGILSAAFRTRRFLEEEREITQQAYDALGMIGLKEKASDIAASLSFGQQRLTDIARVLAGKPKLILLDEPAAGLNAQETSELAALILSLKQNGLTVMLIEHDMSLVMDIADRILVLDHGTKIAEDTPTEIQKNEKVIMAYLGDA